MKVLISLLLLVTTSAFGLIGTAEAVNVNVNTYIPPQAFTLKPIIKKELDNNFPEIPNYNYVPSLAEQESCISLTHSKCWNTHSELKTSREQGLGIWQLTRAYNKDGSVRFDTLKDMRNKYKTELKDLSWDTFRDRPDLQVRTMTLMIRDDYRALYNIQDPFQRLAMTDSAYNGGRGGVYKDRRECSLSKYCDSNIWFDNVEKHCTKSKVALYGKRSACDINREHTKYVMKIRLPKYDKRYFTAKD